MKVLLRTSFTVVVLSLSIRLVLAAGDDSKQVVTACVKTVERAFRESGLLKGQTEFRLTNSNNSVTLSYHTREWLVYYAGKDGRWSAEPRKETGPDTDGIIITASFTPLEDLPSKGSGFGVNETEQWDGRYPNLDLKGMDLAERSEIISPIIRHPYWRTYGCGTVITDRRVWVRVHVAFNNRTNRKLLEQAFSPIVAAFSRDK